MWEAEGSVSFQGFCWEFFPLTQISLLDFEKNASDLTNIQIRYTRLIQHVSWYTVNNPVHVRYISDTYVPINSIRHNLPLNLNALQLIEQCVALIWYGIGRYKLMMPSISKSFIIYCMVYFCVILLIIYNFTVLCYLTTISHKLFP